MIKNGARYQDKWGRIWFAVNYDNATDKWLMHLCNFPYKSWFRAEEIYEWKLISIE